LLPEISRTNFSPALKKILTIAAQDQGLNKRYYQKNTRKQPTDSKCSMCCKAEVHTKHNIAGRTTLVPSEYTIRHNKVAGYIHCTVCKCMGLQVTGKYYEHLPEMVINVKGATIMWDVPAVTDRTILANWPDKVLHDKEENNCLLIDIAIPDDWKFNTKKAEKLSKYKDL
jgi:hypothetical protein